MHIIVIASNHLVSDFNMHSSRNMYRPNYSLATGNSWFQYRNHCFLLDNCSLNQKIAFLDSAYQECRKPPISSIHMYPTRIEKYKVSLYQQENHDFTMEHAVIVLFDIFPLNQNRNDCMIALAYWNWGKHPISGIHMHPDRN